MLTRKLAAKDVVLVCCCDEVHCNLAIIYRDHPFRLAEQLDPDRVSGEGETLVICCEGNAGFYEVGCMVTPFNCGYSVLGWNHPGFMWSSVRRILFI